jgi:hypothetical protein
LLKGGSLGTTCVESQPLVWASWCILMRLRLPVKLCFYMRMRYLLRLER